MEQNSAWPFGRERFTAVPTGIGGCSPTILKPVGYSSGMSLISPQVERSRARRTQVAVGRRGAVAVKSTTVVRPVRPWLQQPYYGAVFDGVTLGAVIAANAVPTSPSIDLCWYWSNSSKTRGYWDFCQ
jgi:hypothetical protein